MPGAVSMIHRVVDEGLDVAVEAYPYGAARTAVGVKTSTRRIYLARA
jgi:hypothetical protein